MAEPGEVRLIHADWLEVLRHVSPGSVDWVYADPPFNTGKVHADRSEREAGSFEDRFGTSREYMDWLEPRVRATLEVLKPTGSIMLHLDWRTSHRARVMLDDLLGEACFINHLVWAYGLGGSSPRRFARKHDDLLWYSRQPDGHWFTPPMVASTSLRMKGRLKKSTDVLTVPSINNMALERTGYPTQKPLTLLKLLVGACCPPGGTVLDPCCGSGTTLVAAKELGRNAIGIDVSTKAMAVARSRLASRPIGVEINEPRGVPTGPARS